VRFVQDKLDLITHATLPRLSATQLNCGNIAECAEVVKPTGW
jgi:hypothetical protein